jgi:hypothetical protein
LSTRILAPLLLIVDEYLSAIPVILEHLQMLKLLFLFADILFDALNTLLQGLLLPVFLLDLLNNLGGKILGQ